MTNSAQKVYVHPANWLPIPETAQLKGSVLQTVDENDLFSKGIISQYYPYQGFGYVKNSRGEEIIFKLDEVELVGPKANKKYLISQCRVGYDVSWASNGLHISKLKPY